MRFTIIIVSWNGKALLERFLPSVVATQHPSFEVVVADNASTDETASFLLGFPTVAHHKLDKNYGYCGGNNRAVPAANGEWLIFLNNDVEVPPNWLEEIDRFLQRVPGVDILQPDILQLNERETYEYAGASGGFLDSLGYPFCRGRVLDVLEKRTSNYARPEFISWASGAALVIRKSVFEKLGGFEETFEFHMEEIDLCWRAWRQGYKTVVCPQAKVYHLGGGSLANNSYRKWFYNVRNSLFMLCRNDFRAGFALRLLLRMTLDGVMAFQQLLLGQPHVFRAVLMAHLSFYRNAGLVLRWRREHLDEQPVNRMPRFKGLLPFHFFVLKKRTFVLLAGRINRTLL